MKKSKIVVISLIGVSIITLGYLFVKNKSKKLEEETEEEEEETEEVLFSDSIISEGKKLRKAIFTLAKGQNSAIEEEVVGILSDGGLMEKKQLWDWYDSQNFSTLSELRGSLEKLLSPTWKWRADTTMMNWKLDNIKPSSSSSSSNGVMGNIGRIFR